MRSTIPGMADAQVPEPRASDGDREQAVETLRHAASDGQLTVEELEERVSSAYGARTRNELAALVADVSPAPAAPARRPEAGVTVSEGSGGTRWLVSIMGGHDKRGRWRVAPRCTVLNIMSGSDIDLNDAELSDPVTELTMISIMGGGTVWLPHGVDVQVSDFALMGGNGAELGEEVAPAGAPRIRIRLISIMGGSEVKRGRKLSREERKRERELRKAARRELEP